MSMRTPQRMLALPHAILFILLMNMGAIASFRSVGAHSRAVIAAQPAGPIAPRAPVGGCGVVRPPAETITPAPSVPVAAARGAGTGAEP